MKCNTRASARLLLVTLLVCTTAQAQVDRSTATFDGTWGGWIDFAGDRSWFQIRKEGETLLLEDFNTMRGGQEARSLDVGKGELRFVYDAPVGPVSFVGSIEGRTLTGELRAEGLAPGRFEFTRFHDMPATQVAAHLGRYETDAGQVLWVVPRSYGGLRLVTNEGEGKRFGDYSFDAWLPWQDVSYFEGNLDGAALPPQRSLHFDGDRLELRGEGALTAHRTAGASVQQVSFDSDGLALQGFLMIPPGTNPRAAIAYAHGSGYVTADHTFDLYHAVRMARHLGIAVLRWDKPGVWRSEGDQGLASYHDLADDVSAAVEWLRNQKGIDPSMVGIGGLSQGPSWPLPIAAANADAITFVVATSGSVTTALETNLFNWTNKIRREGYEEAHIEEFRAFFEDLIPYTLDPSPEGQMVYDAFLADYEEEPWFDRAVSIALLDSRLDDPALDRWRKIWNVDPRDYWKDVGCPVFQSWGAEDPLVDAELCASRMAKLVSKTGQTNFTSIVYPPPADHGVGSANTPTFFDDLSKWFRAEVLSEK